MKKRYANLLALAVLQVFTALVASAAADTAAPPRSAAAHALLEKNDAPSLATAAALTLAGAGTRPKAEAASAALDIAVKAAELAPNDAAIAWLRLRMCAEVPSCHIRDAATIMRWVDAENGAAWLPTLAEAQKERDSTEIERILSDMAEGTRFDLYENRLAVMMFDALKRTRATLPPKYVKSDLARLAEVVELAGLTAMPSFSPLLNACREGAGVERREPCLRLARTMQRADAVMAQLVGFAIERRLLPSDSKQLRVIAERRRILEWRVAAANQSDSPLLPWLRNARARSRIAIMRARPREEDTCIALLREHGISPDPPEERR